MNSGDSKAIGGTGGKSATTQKKVQPSTKSQIIYKSLGMAGLNKKIFNKLLNEPPRGTRAVSYKKLHRSFEVKEQWVDGYGMLTITASPATRKHIFYLHGGAYVAEANSGHRNLMRILAGEYGYRVTFIDYPLAPEQDILTSLAVLEDAYKRLLLQYEEDEFCLMGDSSGGGLALAFLQLLRDKNVDRRPEKTILFSPWLDVGMTNPGIDAQVKKDVLLDKESLIECGKLYAGGLELNDPRLSPLFGALDELQSIKVFVSTHELFYPDCILLHERAATARNTYVDLSVNERMVHDWVILPLRERDEAMKEAASYF